MVMRIVSAGVWLATWLCLVNAVETAGLTFADLDGVAHKPLEPGEKLGSVLIFYWQDCPVCNSYAPEINRIFRSHTNFAFYIVQVDPDLTRTAAKEHAKAYDLRLPVLLDPQHRLVKPARATVTPEAVIFGKDRKTLYRGRIDDLYAALGKKRAAATQHDLVEALDAIGSGKQPKKRETKAVGCLIPTLDH